MLRNFLRRGPMAKESGVSKNKVHSQYFPLQGHLLSLPAELLIEGILSFLPAPSLIACSRTCKSLHDLISSSLLLNYLMELNIAGMLDNPLCTYAGNPLATRLSLLRERERRWLLLQPHWHRQLTLTPPTDRFQLYDIASGHALFGRVKSDVSGVVMSLRLPAEMKGEAVQEEAADIGRHILEFAVALEEHDLIACLNCMDVNNPTDVQVHLISHSTADHHPLACNPVIDVPTPDLLPLAGVVTDRRIWGDIAICGKNIAVSVKYPTSPDPIFTNKLYIWNWNSGILVGQLDLEISGPNDYPLYSIPGMTFLREDILLNPNTMANSLDLYHILHDPLLPSPSVRLVSRFHLPRLAPNIYYSLIQIHIRPPLRSPSTLGTPRNKPFIINPERSMLALEFDLYNPLDGTWLGFSLLVRWQHLLSSGFERLPEFDTSPNSTPMLHAPFITYSWDEWGPQNSRLFPRPEPLVFATTTSGCRFVTLTQAHPSSGPTIHPPRTLEVHDFDDTRIRIAARQAITVKHKGRSTRVLQVRTHDANSNKKAKNTNAKMHPHVRIELVDATSPSVYPGSNRIFSHSVRTQLPYLRTIHMEPAGGRRRLKQKKEQITRWMKGRFRQGDRRHSDTPGERSEDPIRPGLPSQWDGILVDDERIIGIPRDNTGEGLYNALDILYMG